MARRGTSSPASPAPRPFSRAEVARIGRIRDRTKRGLYVLGLITSRLAPGEHDVRPVLVGGFALEFYSTGGYTTADVDALYLWPAKAGALLEQLGFTKVNRHWVSERYGLQIEFPGHAIERRAVERVADVSVGGVTCRVIGVEDLILDRLNGAVHASSSDDLRWAHELLVLYRDRIDLAYLRKQAAADRTSAALKRIETGLP